MTMFPMPGLDGRGDSRRAAACAVVPDRRPEAPPPAACRRRATAPAAAAPTAPPSCATVARALGGCRALERAARLDRDAAARAVACAARGCDKPAPGWEAVCACAQAASQPATPTPPVADAAAPAAVARREPGGQRQGLATGYFDRWWRRCASRSGPLPRAAAPRCRRPRHAQAWWTRQQIDTLPAAAPRLRGRELAWVDDPLDALLLQVQGLPGRLLSSARPTARGARCAGLGRPQRPALPSPSAAG